ncbi:hypothetical protein KUV89_14905 [Marinobacter hydrocarbonoclasticus]|nr:hypothetical protein [Marinobacter nauticus]
MQVMARYLQNMQNRMVMTLVTARILGLLLLLMSGVELANGLSDGKPGLVYLAFIQIYHLALGLMLLTLAIRVVKMASEQRLFTDGCRRLMILLARVGLLAAFLVKPCGLMVLSSMAQGAVPEPAFLIYVALVDWPVVLLSGLLHLMAGIQKLGGDMNAEQELTI